MTYNTFTLTGTFKKPNGTADKGGVIVIPSVTPLVDASGKIVLAGAVDPVARHLARARLAELTPLSR